MKVTVLWIAGLILAMTAGQVQASFITYDANSAFLANEASVESNPFGPFSAGHFDDAFPGSFTPFAAAEHTNNWVGESGLQGWSTDNFLVIPAVVVNTSAAPINTYYGATIAPHQIVMHESGAGSSGLDIPPIDNAILRFTAPTSGIYTIDGNWQQLHNGVTNDLILHNGTTIFSSFGNSLFNLTETLTVGDHIDFIVNQGPGNIYGDTTGLFATLSIESAAVPEPASIAMWGLGALGMIFAGRKRRRMKLRAKRGQVQ